MSGPAIAQEELQVTIMQIVIEKHLLMVAEQTDNVIQPLPEVKDPIDNLSGIGTPVDIIPDEDEAVVPCIDIQAGDQRFQLRCTTVNIPDGINTGS